MNVLVLLAYYLPSYKAGGPVRSVANLAARLGDEIDFHVLAADRDLGDGQRFESINSARWQNVGKARVAYLPPRRMPTLRVAQYVRDVQPDVVYVNSFFHHRSCAGPLMLRRGGLLAKAPIIIAPRGEFGAGALAIRAWKKRPYLAAARALGLMRDVLWHATSESERDDVLRVIGRDANIVTAPNLCELNADAPARVAPKRRGELRLVYLSRISPKKNLLGAIELLQEAPGDVCFDIWGPIEDAVYWQRCCRQIGQLKANVTVIYRGAVAPEKVLPTLAQYDAMLFPTLGENFGHAIVESFSAGCPAIISDRTPWRQLAARGAGWDLPIDEPEAFRSALATLADMDDAAHRALRSRTARFGWEVTHNRDGVDASRKMFRRAADGASAGGRSRVWSRAA